MSAFDRRFWLLSSSTFLLACSLLDTPLCNAQGLQHPYSLPRVAGAIDESSLVSLRGNTHPLAQLKYDQGPAPISMPANRLLLVLARSTQQEADLQTWLQSVQDANSPNYRKFLSPEDFGKRFGVGDADLQAIQTWLAGHGFTVNKVSKGRMAIEFSGSVGQVQDAFHTSLHSYIVNGEQHWANATDPQIPSALASAVAGFSSLNNFKPRTQYIRGPSGIFNAQTRTITPAYTDTDGYGDYYIYLGPSDAATIYNTPTSLNANLVGTAYDGTGVTIGVAGDSNIDVAQNANYRSTFGLTPNPTTVVVDGNDPGENGDSIEAYLDTQVSGGIAPNANIILYTAADNSLQQGLFLAIQRAIDDNQADILNVSFGECEAALGASGNQYIQNLWEQAAAQGISVVVSAGDSGPAGCDNPDTESLAYLGLAVNGLASTPDNIAVGGTDFDILYSNFPSSFTTYVNTTNTLPNRRSAFGYIPEEPWNDSTYPNSDISENVSLNHNSASLSGDDIIAGGGGISSLYTIPSWQASFASGGYRNLPDVSLLAGNGFYGALWSICTDQAPAGYADCAAGATGNSFYLTGIGGTSASAPAFAGMLALVKQKTGIRLGHAGYVLYDLAKTSYSTVFHDITTGDNSVNCEIINGGCSEDTAGYYFMNGYNATVGYDMASGLGSVNASQMVSNWASPGFNATTSSLQLNGATAPLSITHGQSVAVNSSVTSASGTPSGNIALVDNLTPANLPNSEGIGDFTLSSGSVSGTTNSLPGGTYQVSAHYGGSGTFAQSDSNAISVTVGPESSNTTIKVVGYYDPASGKAATTPYYGFKFVIDAQPYGNSASAANPNGVATGIVTFKNGSTTLSTATLASNGIAEMQTTLLPGGTDTLTAAFPGDASFLASTSSPYPFTVVPAVSTLAIPSYQASYNNVISVGVLLSVDSAGAAPTGTVTIQNGSTALGSAPLYGIVAVGTTPTWGSATFDSSSLPPGTYNITAVYSGDGNYGSSTSPVVSLTLGRANSSITVSTSATIISANQPLQVTVTPAPLAGLPLPTGSATLTYGSVTTPPADLVNGTASFTIPPNSLPLGFGPIAGNYSGDADYASGSANAWVTVNSSGTVKPIVTVTGPSVTVNYPVSITVTVSGLSGDPTPTGSVTLTTVAGQNSMPLTNGSAIFTLQNGLLAGPSPVIAVYLGDLNYTSGSGSTTVDTFAPVAISFAPYPLPTIEANQPLSLTVAIVGYPNFQTATGTVTLSSGSYTSGPIQMASGSASFNIPANALSVGIDTLTASYSGDSNYLAGSNTEPVTVTAIPSPSFSLTGTAVTVAPGSSSTSTVTITPSGGFTGSVVMSTVLTSTPSGADYLPNLSFSSTNPVAITGASAGTATLTVYTTAATSAALAHPKHPGTPWYAVGGATLACLLLLGIPARRRSWRRALGMLTLLVVLSSGVFACGGGGGSGGGGGGGGGTGNPGTTAGAYIITVVGTSGTITVNGTIALAVQ